MHYRLRQVIAAAVLALTFAACGDDGGESVILATTTSTQDSGLLDELIPAFERESGIQIKTIAVGSGEAIELGARGEADVVLAHSPAAEQELMAAGKGGERRTVMHNDFVIVGPATDPAKIQDA
ncbi:MAG: substrate-binding domain-containing protein, partial [Actinobacteria bacterium]|nr:substrate-binding domain-containing protein [Actinomycetota bacterium]